MENRKFCIFRNKKCKISRFFAITKFTIRSYLNVCFAIVIIEKKLKFLMFQKTFAVAGQFEKEVAGNDNSSPATLAKFGTRSRTYFRNSLSFFDVASARLFSSAESAEYH